jgi:hypothetical protein
MPDSDGKRTGYCTGDASVPQTYDFHYHARSQQRAAISAYAIRRENKIGVPY